MEFRSGLRRGLSGIGWLLSGLVELREKLGRASKKA